MLSVRSYRRILYVSILAVLMAVCVHAQFRMGGDVVDVIDGKTLVVSVPSGLVTVELQYIDTPEVGQSLHGEMKNHVRTLLVGKAVQLHTRGLYRGRMVGKVVLDGVDVSQQLLRNGAAWHLARDTFGQSQDEFAAYAESEALARLEKRGVWSVAGLEPAWEFREKKKAAEAPKSVPTPKATVAESQIISKPKGYWSDTNPRLKPPSGLSYGFNASTQAGFLGMAVFGVAQTSDTPRGQKTAVDITYYYWEKEKGRTGYFQVSVFSLSEKWRFLKDNALTIEADGKKVRVAKPKRESTNSPDGVAERLTYQLDVATVEKIVFAGEIKLLVGGYAMTPKPMAQMLLYKLLQAAKQ